MKTDLQDRRRDLALSLRSDLVIARARAALGSSVSVPPPVPLVQVTITCARVGLTYLGAGKRVRDKLVLSSWSSIPRRASATDADTGAGAGFFTGVQFPSGFVCPGCRRPHSGSVWVCHCARFSGALHTCGDAGRAGVCACGLSEVLHFEEAAGAELRGSVSTPRAAIGSGSAGSAPQLPGRAQLLLPGKNQ